MRIVERYRVPLASVTTTVAASATPAWAAGTTYAAGDEVLRDSRIYVSAVDGNVGIDPATVNQQLVSAPWIFRAFENRFRCFDETIASRTVNAGPVTMTIDGVAGQDSLLLFGVSGQSLHVTGRNAVDAVIFEREFTLAARDVSDWYEWFYQPFGEPASRVAILDLPVGLSSLTLAFDGAQVEIGEILIGRSWLIGSALHQGTGHRVISSTRVEFNAYGEPTVIPGLTRTESTFRVHITKARLQQVFDLLARLSGRLVGAVGSPSRQSTVQLGYLSLDEIPEDLPDDYIATLTLRGVT